MTEDETNYWLRIFIRESLSVEDVGHLLINPDERYRAEAFDNIQVAWDNFKEQHRITE